MKVNYVFLLVALLAIPFCTSQLYKCSDKGLFQVSDSSNSLVLKSNDADVEFAYNEAASCATLSTEKEDGMCCYMKLKFDNTQYEETFTQKGCYELSLSNYLDVNDDVDFDDIIDDIEEKINKANVNKYVDVDKVNIDCSSKFIQLVGISLLLLLL